MLTRGCQRTGGFLSSVVLNSEKEKERDQLLLQTQHWGLSPKPGYVPRLGINLGATPAEGELFKLLFINVDACPLVMIIQKL